MSLVPKNVVNAVSTLVLSPPSNCMKRTVSGVVEKSCFGHAYKRHSIGYSIVTSSLVHGSLEVVSFNGRFIVGIRICNIAISACLRICRPPTTHPLYVLL